MIAPSLSRAFLCALALGPWAALKSATIPSAASFRPNLVDNLDRPLRYTPDGEDFVIHNGAEVFNRPLYGGNTAFRVDGGDRPEFVLYLPGRGGNLRLGLRKGGQAKWLLSCRDIEFRYRPGELRYVISDELLGEGKVRITAIAYAETEGLILQIEGEGASSDAELIFAYGGITGQRGRRDGDIGTESVPISEWFQLKPEFAANNSVELQPGRFSVTAKAATMTGVTPPDARLQLGDAHSWNDPVQLFTPRKSPPSNPVVVGSMALQGPAPIYLSLQRSAAPSAPAADLDTYRAVTTTTAPTPTPRPAAVLRPTYAYSELSDAFQRAQQHFSVIRRQVSVRTPDHFINAAVGALNVAADAVWDEPQKAIMHGAIAWRTKLLGWRGPYVLDALGWHDRAAQNIRYWAGRQNTSPIPDQVPPADEKANLARNEVGLHTNGDMSNSHYDMNLVFIDAVIRHLRWTGDATLARELWPVIERHLAWERRLFRRDYGENLPLYEAYAAIWASDDLQYSGGGAAHTSAYNAFHHREAAKIAQFLGKDPASYLAEAQRIERAMRSLLWLPGGGFAEYKDWLGHRSVHPNAALWTHYHVIDSEIPSVAEARAMLEKLHAEIPHLPVRGPGVPRDLFTLSTTSWMPYQWSINNVVMSEVMHTALASWQVGETEGAWRMFKGSLLAAMYMGISPGNVGSMSYHDVYRRESQRDFADGSGTLSRALVEGLFGLRPNALYGELTVQPAFPEEWQFAEIDHPKVRLAFTRTDNRDEYRVTQRFGTPQRLTFRVPQRANVAAVHVNGKEIPWSITEGVARPYIHVTAPAADAHHISVLWTGPTHEGSPIDLSWPRADLPVTAAHAAASQSCDATSLLKIPAAERTQRPVQLDTVFNDRVTQIFRNEYRSPRSPFVSLALPKQGIGGWAGGVNATAEIDDTGLRKVAASNTGQIRLPNGAVLTTPAEPHAKNVAFVSLWDNYPDELSVPLSGSGEFIVLMVAGSANAMQSRFQNGEIIVQYRDGFSTVLPLINPINWWPIEQDYFIDDFQFRRPEPLPLRIDLKTGAVRELQFPTFKGAGRSVPGGAATVLCIPLHKDRELAWLTLHATANDVVIGVMAATVIEHTAQRN
jgi:hypothetical protein